jgi:alkylation response protein AidB-like acyl-CoA dehydrogenase
VTTELARRDTTGDLETVCKTARDHRDYGERHSTLHPAVWQALHASPLPAAALPLSFGGLQWPAGQIIDAVRQLALADPSAGWAAAIHAPAGAFTARLDTQTAAELGLGPGNPPPLIAGSSIPAGTAEPDNEHVRLRGTWPLVTSAPQMTLAVLAAPDPDDHATRWWWVPQDNVQVLEDWDAVGLRGSASCSVACDTLVPRDHAVRLTEPAVFDEPLYRFPLYGLMAACIAAVAQATAEQALAEFRELATTATPRHAAATLANLGPVQERYAHAATRLSAAAAHADSTVEAAWKAAENGRVHGVERAALRAACSHLVQTSATVCQDLFETAGSAAVYRGPVERGWRDSAVAARHALVASRGRQLAGALMLTGTAAKDL